MKQGHQSIAKNRKATHEYEILEVFEAGVVLTGTEVRSLRDNHCQMTDCFALVRGGEVWLHNVHIAPYINGTYNNVDPDRIRKLLLHRKEISKLDNALRERGLALVPLSMYFDENGRVKVEIAIARGKKTYDKRASMADRDAKRDIERALKTRSR